MCAIQGCVEPAEFAGLCRDHGRHLAALLKSGIPAKSSSDPAPAADQHLSIDILERLAERAREALKAVDG